MQPSSRHDQCRVTASGSREGRGSFDRHFEVLAVGPGFLAEGTSRRSPTPGRSTPQFLRCVTGETFLTFRNENGLHLSDPLCIMNLTGNNIRHTKESMGSTPADRSGLTGKQSCGRRISCACCFPESLRKGRRQLGVVGLFPFSRRYDVDASVRVATADRFSTNANENHLHLMRNCGIMIPTKTTCARTKPLRLARGDLRDRGHARGSRFSFRPCCFSGSPTGPATG